MESTPFRTSRIDKSVADRIRDIQNSFDEDSELVMDFILFITYRLQENLFGYTNFTLKDFVLFTGRNRQDLSNTHPKFRSVNSKPPVYNGHEFKSVFDYSLYNMLHKNIIFSKAYKYETNNEEIILEKFSILEEIRLNINRAANAKKKYNIRVSNELFQGFINRYYTLDVEGYKAVGKGKYGCYRKRLFLYINKTRHIVLSQGYNETNVALDYLAYNINLEIKDNRQRKKSINRLLRSIAEKANLPFTFKWSKDPSTDKFNYRCRLKFEPAHTERKGLNNFYKNLDIEIRGCYEYSYKDSYPDYQDWLNNNSLAITDKIYCLKKSYIKSFNKDISEHESRYILFKGFKI